MSGELNPDAAGTYQQIPDVYGYPAARRLDDAYTIYYIPIAETYMIVAGTETPDSAPTDHWYKGVASTNIEGEYLDSGEYTGTATFAWL